ncbi:MAG: hypothetical protein JO097_09345 [Acidobacteriaceae bacterium]|nr:hypothetical protein [Acidobacteriaceae bacterium]
MRLAGFLLMPTGWAIVLAALMLLTSLPSRTCFVIAGMGIEMLGLILAARSHLLSRGAKRDA